jgi:uncharacterized protein (DUF2336 family)
MKDTTYEVLKIIDEEKESPSREEMDALENEIQELAEEDVARIRRNAFLHLNDGTKFPARIVFLLASDALKFHESKWNYDD